MKKECPQCKRPVLRVEVRPSTKVFIHKEGEKPGQLFGCAVSMADRGKR